VTDPVAHIRPGDPVLLTGASGYVGGRLLPRLERRGLAVRCIARRPEYLARRVGPDTEVVEGDVLREETLVAPLEGVHTAYYLGALDGQLGRAGFEEQERRAAENVARAASAAGVRRTVYLGGLGEELEDLSPHLRSRHEVGRILGSSDVPVIEFRASIVIGSGSLPFEMIRALVERLQPRAPPTEQKTAYQTPERAFESLSIGSWSGPCGLAPAYSGQAPPASVLANPGPNGCFRYPGDGAPP
jgi:uncharacterized protein YbjT (DUF2867 family)